MSFTAGNSYILILYLRQALTYLRQVISSPEAGGGMGRKILHYTFFQHWSQITTFYKTEFEMTSVADTHRLERCWKRGIWLKSVIQAEKGGTGVWLTCVRYLSCGRYLTHWSHVFELHILIELRDTYFHIEVSYWKCASYFAHLCEVCELSLSSEMRLPKLVFTKQGVPQMQNTRNDL